LAKKSKQQAKASGGRNRWVLIGAGAVLAVIAVAAVISFTRGGGGSSSRPSALAPTPVIVDSQQASVDVVDTKFTPAAIKIKKGTTVTWNFKGNVSHTVTSVPGTGPIQPTTTNGTPAATIHFDSGGRPKGKTFEFTFDEPGTYNYFCTIHHVMEGTVYVTG
jgi:plastocyanin